MNRISPGAGRPERDLAYGLLGGLSAGMRQLEHDLCPMPVHSVHQFPEARNQLIGVNTCLMKARPAQMIHVHVAADKGRSHPWRD